MRRAPLLWGAFAPFALISAFHLGVKAAGLVELDRATKGLTVPSLILGVVIVLVVGRMRLSWPVLATLVAGLVLSWLGDITLSDFTIGLSFFLAAHLVYIAMFLVCFRRRPSFWTIGYLPWYGGLLLAVWPYLGNLAPVVAIYGLVLGLMSTAATRGNVTAAMGGVLFVVSDSLLAFRLFTPLFSSAAEDVVIMGLYLGAQLLITLGVLRTATAREPHPVRA